jgi:hypothetical protein
MTGLELMTSAFQATVDVVQNTNRIPTIESLASTIPGIAEAIGEQTKWMAEINGKMQAIADNLGVNLDPEPAKPVSEFIRYADCNWRDVKEFDPAKTLPDPLLAMGFKPQHCYDSRYFLVNGQPDIVTIQKTIQEIKSNGFTNAEVDIEWGDVKDNKEAAAVLRLVAYEVRSAIPSIELACYGWPDHPYPHFQNGEYEKNLAKLEDDAAYFAEQLTGYYDILSPSWYLPNMASGSAYVGREVEIPIVRYRMRELYRKYFAAFKVVPNISFRYQGATNLPMLYQLAWQQDLITAKMLCHGVCIFCEHTSTAEEFIAAGLDKAVGEVCG